VRRPSTECSRTESERDRGPLAIDEEEDRVAYLMGGPAGATRFAVLDGAGNVVFRGDAGQSRGSWNARSRFVDDVRSWQTVEPALDFTGPPRWRSRSSARR
jgi:hypothetical protein